MTKKINFGEKNGFFISPTSFFIYSMSSVVVYVKRYAQNKILVFLSFFLIIGQFLLALKVEVKADS